MAIKAEMARRAVRLSRTGNRSSFLTTIIFILRMSEENVSRGRREAMLTAILSSTLFNPDRPKKLLALSICLYLTFRFHSAIL